MTTCTISVERFAALCASGKELDLIDVRTPVEYREVHVEFARNVPLDRLNPEKVMSSRSQGHEEPLYVICRSGSRGKQACEKFHRAGFTNVLNVEGGTIACEQTGVPLVRGQKSMSLERQVRIAAGSLVLVGCTLAWLVHPVFLGLSAFVGAGLVFAGLTDTCAMGMLLAKMPWNKCN